MTQSSGVRIEVVESKAQLNAFLEFPFLIYRDDDVWVPPILFLDRLEYRRGTNLVLQRSPHRLFLAYRNGTVQARLIAYVDPRFVTYTGQPTGFFGAFESVDDPEVVLLLFDTASEWLRSRDVERIRGPMDPVAECWGLVVDGYDRSPVFMSPHNPPYYPGLVERAGFEKVKDLIVYEIDTEKGYELPRRFRDFSRTMTKRNPELSVRNLEKKEIERDAAIILDLLNRGVADNWGFVPVGEDEMRDITGKLKLIIDPDAVCIVEDKGVPVGCAIGFPDVNVLIKKIRGRLLPFGFLRLLLGIRKLRDYRLWGLAVLPEYHGRGLDVLLYSRLYEALKPRGIRMEANYVLEDNFRIINPLEKLGMVPIKRYRVYEKDI